VKIKKKSEFHVFYLNNKNKPKTARVLNTWVKVRNCNNLEIRPFCIMMCTRIRFSDKNGLASHIVLTNY